MTQLDAVFYEEFESATGEEVQPVSKALDDSLARWGANMRPAWQRPSATYTPVLNYRWTTSRAALHEPA